MRAAIYATICDVLLPGGEAMVIVNMTDLFIRICRARGYEAFDLMDAEHAGEVAAIRAANY